MFKKIEKLIILAIDNIESNIVSNEYAMAKAWGDGYLEGRKDMIRDLRAKHKAYFIKRRFK